MNFIRRLLSAYMRFMQGRYMKLDSINISLLLFYLLMGILSVFLHNPLWIRVLLLMIALVFLFRYLSRNVTARQRANQKWMSILSRLHIDRISQKLSNAFRKYFGRRNRAKMDPAHVYFACPYCKSNLRVPRNAGTIMVTCPICKKQFKKTT